MKVQLEERKTNVERSKPSENAELQKVLEELNDSKETNVALQLQLNCLNEANLQLKSTYDELSAVNANLEKRVLDAESVLTKCSQEIQLLKEQREKLLEAETNLNNLLEIEKMQVKNLKVQNEKDARCILDLNRQVKEMERIIARKHPDSVSALIVAAKNDQSENNLTARKVLEDRIRNLETEVVMRDQQSSKVFLEVQEKFTEMKNKYESHIEDLELHVNDLKNQIKKKRDTFDVYTQTVFDERNPVKDTKAVGVQTLQNKIQMPKIVFNKKVEKVECRDDAHLIATIRGLQTDLVNKEKVILKMQKELDEARKTNKRLQKEREGSLRNIAEKREFRSYPEKLALQLKGDDVNLEEELKALKTERDKMKIQLCRMEEDYQSLKAKRLFDLSALQQAHESEVTTYMTNIGPLRDQLQSQQKTIECLQEQLKVSKEQVDVLRLDRDDLMKRVHLFGVGGDVQMGNGSTSSKKIYAEEDENGYHDCRLNAIMHTLVQGRGCQQCVARQQQLIIYKTELDQLLATVRTLA
ncbi:hypothetical protein FQR65_LT01404 [Abscondita terminalis]|nr:hypothetical protein FQR65_LT01404 [Abscondita terminalis]